MHNPELARGLMEELHAQGLQLHIDDFGTGYSSLASLQNLSVDELKIDQSFVQAMATDASARAIVRAIVSLGHSLEMEVIAEGVETAEQLALLRAEGCDEIQGFYFARPMNAKDFIAFAGNQRVLARIA